MNSPDHPVRRAPSSRQILVSGTLVALVLALAAAWVFVVRPASSDSTITPDELVGSDTADEAADDAVAEVGQPTPDLTLNDFDGSPVTIDSLRGKPVVINFWASTCAPCVKEMPLLERIHQRLGDEVEFVGVDAFESPELGRKMIDSTGVTYRQTLDPTNEALGAFGGAQLPHTVVLTADGTVSALHSTAITDEQVLLDLIDEAGA